MFILFELVHRNDSEVIQKKIDKNWQINYNYISYIGPHINQG